METDEAILAARAKLFAKMGNKATTGGKGTQRRKQPAKRAPTVTDDKKLQAQVKRMGCQQIPGIEEVNMFTDEGKVIHFEQPKLQASLGSNTYVVSGSGEKKELQELLPGIITQLGTDNLPFLQNFAKTMQGGEDKAEDDDIPDDDLNFEEVSKA